jgi:L-alanine-DL-glutamate epimerase-like enolase superfamily enzyme
MPERAPQVVDGQVSAPTEPGFGITPRSDFLEEYEVK